MQILCAQCRNPIEVAAVSKDTEIVCPACGSSFTLEGESTVDWKPRAEQTIGRFRLQQFVGQGAFGLVYMAHDTELDRVVAIKIPRAPQAERSPDGDRFLREARSVARLRHPNIVPVHEVGRHEHLPYLVTDFIVGVTLSDRLTTRRPTFREAAELIATLADALQYAHENGVVHRDVKPSNIMLDASGAAFLMDFGLARRDAGEVSITADGQVLGTPAYMSPEQARGEGHTVDARGDVYSLGVVLYQLLTGELPFRGNTRMLLHQVLNDEPRPPRSLNDHIPRDLQTVCLKAMAKDPARRYASAKDMADDLRRWLAGEPIRARPVGTLERTWRWVRRHPTQAALGAMTALAALAVVASAVGMSYNRKLRDAYAEEAGAREAAEQAKRETDAASGQLKEALAVTRQARDETQKALGLATTYAYFHRIGLADAAVRDADVERAAALLAECPKDQRHWEWGYLSQQTKAPLLSAATGLRETVRQLIVTPDGKHLVGGTEAGEVAVWEADGLKPLWTRQAAVARHFVVPVAVSPDGTTVALGLADGRILFWNVADGTPRRELPAAGPDIAARPIVGLAWSLTGKHLAVATPTSLALRDAASGEVARRFGPVRGTITRLSFHPDGKALATAGTEALVRVWDLDTGAVRQTIAPRQGHPLDVACHPGGRLLATGGFRGVVDVWNPDGSAALQAAGRHDFTVWQVAFRPDGDQVASCSSDGTVQVHPLRTGPSVVYRGHRGHVYALAFHPEGNRLYSAGVDNTVKVWDATRPPEGRQALPAAVVSEMTRVRFFPDGKRLLTAGLDNAFQVRDADTARVTQTLVSLTPRRGIDVKILAVHPDGNRVALGIVGAGLVLYDVSGNKQVWGLPQKAGIHAAAFTPDGKHLLTGDKAGTLHLRDLGTGAAARTWSGHEAPVGQVVFSRDGNWLATSGGVGNVAVWDARTWQVAHRLGEGAKAGFSLEALAFSPDGGLLAGNAEDGTIRLWKTADGVLVRTLPGHQGATYDLAFHPDGRRLISGGMDRRIRVWDVRTGESAVTLRAHGNQVMGLDLDPTGTRLAATDQNQALVILSGEEATPAWQAARRDRQAADLRAWQRGELELALRNQYWFGAEWLASRLIAARASQPADFAARGKARAELGKRDLARADYAEAWKSPDSAFDTGSTLALLHHEAGDAAGHRAVVGEILRRHGGTTDPLQANNVAWAAVRFPAALDKVEPAEKLARLAAASPLFQDRSMPLNTLGAALHRAGNHKEAVETLEEAIRARDGRGLLEDWVFLSLACQKLGQHEAAAKWLAQAKQALAKPRPAAKADEKVVPLRDLEATLLVREAAREVVAKDR